MKFLFTLAFTVLGMASSAQTVKPNTSEFVMECMKQHGEMPDKQMVLWFPYNFWQIVGEQMKLDAGYVKQLTSEMSNYMLFAVVDYHYSGSTGGLTFKSEEEIRKSIKLYDSSKNVYLPLDNKDISSNVALIMKNMEPTMAQMLGQFGAGMRLFIFDAKKVNGKPTIEVAKANNFTLSWGNTDMKWTLPFASVLAPKYCPVDKEQLKGNWNYCPIHGVKVDN